MAYRVRQGREFVIPPTGLSYTGSFLYQMDHAGETNYKPNPVLEKALDVLFLLHADHELNASATTVLQTSSSLVDPYSAIAYVSRMWDQVETKKLLIYLVPAVLHCMGLYMVSTALFLNPITALA